MRTLGVCALLLLLLIVLTTLAVGQELVVLPLATNGAGKYYATADIGTPAVSFNLFVSSVSSDLLVSSSGCTPRCDYSPSYDPSNSSTSRLLCEAQSSCTFVQDFAGHDATAAGDSYLDTVKLGSSHLVGTPLGAWTTIHNMHLLVPSPMSGILGLEASPRGSSVSNTTVLRQLSSSTTSLSYSLCLGEYGGMLLVGGVDDNLHSGSWQTAALSSQLALTTTSIGVIASDTVTLDLSSLLSVVNPTVVDTTFRELVVNEAVYSLLANAMQQSCSSSKPGLCEDGFFGPNERCYYIDAPDLVDYPKISIKLLGVNSPVELVLQPDQWLMFVQKKGYCLAITSSADPGTRIGTQALTGYYTAVNFTANTVAFAPPTNCTGALYKIDMKSGNNQKGPVSTRAKNPLVVQVLSMDTWEPVAGVYVNFQVIEGSASLTDITPTDSRGYASASLIFGDAEGHLTIIASLSRAISSPIVFNAESERPVVYLVMSIIFTTLLVIGLGVIYWITERHRKQQLQRLINSPIYHLLAATEKSH